MPTFADAIYDWMVKYKQYSVKPTTYDRLCRSYELFMKYELASIDISKVTTQDLQKHINALVTDNYALTTIKKQHHLVTAFMKYAFGEGLIQKPLYLNVKLPSNATVRKKKKELAVYSKEEQNRLLDILRSNDKPGYGAAILMLEQGLRVGEVLALTWNDIDWEQRSIHVHKTLIRLASTHEYVVQDDAKSYTSNRTIPISSDSFQLLCRLDKYNHSNNYIFKSKDGSALTYEALRYQIQNACQKAKVPYKGQHVFRHTFATNCYYKGCNVKILSKLLGHSDVNITYNTYIHLYGDALEEMRQVID